MPSAFALPIERRPVHCRYLGGQRELFCRKAFFRKGLCRKSWGLKHIPLKNRTQMDRGAGNSNRVRQGPASGLPAGTKVVPPPAMIQTLKKSRRKKRSAPKRKGRTT